MKQPKIILLDGMPTSGKSTISYELARNLPGWLFADIWRFKDIFETLGYSKGLDKKEKDALEKIAKEALVKLIRGVIRKTQRNIILQDTTPKFVKKNFGKDLKKFNYNFQVIQLKVPFKEAKKRNKKRDKPDLSFMKTWTEERWESKIKKKIKKGDIVVDSFKNTPEQVVKIILKAIGEKSKKHPYEKHIRKYW